MSNQYSFSLVTKQRKDAEKLLVRAEEVLKELDPDENSGVKFNLIENDTIFGIGDRAAVSKNGELEEIELWQVVVHLQDIEDYQQVLACLQKKT